MRRWRSWSRCGETRLHARGNRYESRPRIMKAEVCVRSLSPMSVPGGRHSPLPAGRRRGPALPSALACGSLAPSRWVVSRFDFPVLSQSYVLAKTYPDMLRTARWAGVVLRPHSSDDDRGVTLRDNRSKCYQESIPSVRRWGTSIMRQRSQPDPCSGYIICEAICSRFGSLRNCQSRPYICAIPRDTSSGVFAAMHPASIMRSMWRVQNCAGLRSAALHIVRQRMRVSATC